MAYSEEMPENNKSTLTNDVAEPGDLPTSAAPPGSKLSCTNGSDNSDELLGEAENELATASTNEVTDE